MESKILYYLILMIFFTCCKTEVKENIKGGVNIINAKSTDITTFAIPDSFKKEGDILSDSLFVSIPSEGTIVEVAI